MKISRAIWEHPYMWLHFPLYLKQYLGHRECSSHWLERLNRGPNVVVDRDAAPQIRVANL